MLGTGRGEGSSPGSGAARPMAPQPHTALKGHRAEMEPGAGSENKHHRLDIAENKISPSGPLWDPFLKGSSLPLCAAIPWRRGGDRLCCLLHSLGNDRNKSTASHFCVLRATRVKMGMSGTGHIHLLPFTC